MLSKELLETMAQQGQGSRSFCASYRVKVYTVNGVQIGLPGVGEGVHRLTFPAGYVIKEAMDAPTWIRFATDKEIAEETPAGYHAPWWREIDFNRGPLFIAMGQLHLRTSLLAYVETP